MGPDNEAMLGTQIQNMHGNKVRKEGKPHGNPPPQGIMYVKGRTTVARQLFPSIQDDFAENGISI
jgi:hypothetical protein